MPLEAAIVERLGDELYEALRTRTTVAPLTARHPSITVDDAYAISRRLLARRLAAGERVVGKKIGVTSAPVQDMLNVRTPDFGFLTDAMVVPDGGELPVSTHMIQPRAECELAFRLNADLKGPGVCDADVLAATAEVMPSFEIVDSRIQDWKIAYCDTVADNASSGMYVLGPGVDPTGIDLATAELTATKNGVFLARGTGREALTGSPKLGTPVAAVAWLANTLGAYGIELQAGEVILSGSLIKLEPVAAGDAMTMTIAGVGSASVKFV